MEEGRELPVGWEEASGLDIFQLVTSGSRGWAQYYADDGPLFIRIGNLNHGSIEIDLSEIQCVQPPGGAEGERTRLQVNDILVSITAELGMIGLVPADLGEAYINQHVALARPADEVEPRFLAWYLASEYDGKRQLLEMKRGATKVGLGLPDIRNLLLPIAPLNEQRRIAAKLDTTLAAVDACRQRLDGVEALLKRFRQAVLAAATSGELTREWRGEMGRYLHQWEDKNVGDIVTDIDAGLNLKCEERPPEGDERGLVKISAVTWGTYDEEESKTLSQDAVVSEVNRIRLGDFLISRANTIELVGACVIVHQVSRQLYLSDKVLRLVMPEEYKMWLLHCLRSPSGRRQIESLSSGNQLSMRNLAQKNLLSIKIRMPPVDELEAIKHAANRLFSLAHQLEARLTDARKVVDRLTPALLAKAFRGELVPQDPGDEPASALLERLAAMKWAARQAEAAASGPSRRGRKKAAASQATVALEAAPVPPDYLAALLKECGALSERALLAASELEPARFRAQLALERGRGAIRATAEDGEQVLLEAST